MIYLDHAAATPMREEVRQAMEPYFSREFFNPSAAYLPAKRVREAYEAARAELARSIGAKGTDLIITAGATESINLAFTAAEPEAKLLVSATEHKAVLAVAEGRRRELIKVGRGGELDLADLQAKLDDEVELVSVSLVDSELGTIQPLSEIAQLIRQERARRQRAGESRPLYLHSDASQALNLLDVNVARLGVDLLTINAAKIYGPKGVGALYRAPGVKLRPLIRGGGQEQGLRSGTENVAGLLGFAKAASLAKSHLTVNRAKYRELAQILRAELGERALFLGSQKRQLASFIPLSYPGLDAERLVYKLEERGVLVATGAACAASRGERSHVLKAIGLSDEEIMGSLRLSLGELNDAENIREAARLIRTAAEEEYARVEARESQGERSELRVARELGAGIAEGPGSAQEEQD